MAIFDRYNNREIFLNNQERFKNVFKKRYVQSIEQYNTSEFSYPTVGEMQSFTLESIVWKRGMRFYKLAGLFYNDPEMWWVIAWWNRMPTESHVKIGWSIDIPLPLEEVLPIWNK